MGYAVKILLQAIGIWIPVMLFVTFGMSTLLPICFYSAAIYAGADITWELLLIDNLLPATLGNLVEEFCWWVVFIGICFEGEIMRRYSYSLFSSIKKITIFEPIFSSVKEYLHLCIKIFEYGRKF